jgi:hypothetical protein
MVRKRVDVRMSRVAITLWDPTPALRAMGHVFLCGVRSGTLPPARSIRDPSGQKDACAR